MATKNAQLASVPAFQMISGVYVLIDPRTNRRMYCGQAVDVLYRYRQHTDPKMGGYQWDNNRDKVRWIEGLRREGLKPKLEILAECEWPESDRVEQFYIKTFKANGQCELNVASGGKHSRAVSKFANVHQDEWFQLGRRINAMEALLAEITAALGPIAGPKYVGDAIRVKQELDRLKSKLDSKLVATYPEWKEFAEVFYGTEE